MYPGPMILVLWLAFAAYWLISAFGTKKSVPGSRRRGSAIRILFVVGFWLVFDNPAVRRYVGDHPLSSDPVFRIIGVLMCTAGMAFAFWARTHLGRNWGVPMSLARRP